MESVKSRKCIKCGVIVPSTPLGMISHWKKYHNEPPKEVTDAELKRRKDFRTYFNKKVKENPKKYQLKEISVLPTTKLSKQVICKKVDNFLKDVSNSTFTDVISKTSEEKEGPQKKVVVKEEVPVHVPHFACQQCGESLIGLMPAFAHFAQHRTQNNAVAKKTPQTEPKEPDAKISLKKSFSEVTIKTEGPHGASSESAKTFKSAEKDGFAESIKVRMLSKEENQSIAYASNGKASKMTEITVKNATRNTSTFDKATTSRSTASTPSCHPAKIALKPVLHAKFSNILYQEEENLQPVCKQMANNESSIYVSTSQSICHSVKVKSLEKRGPVKPAPQTCVTDNLGQSPRVSYPRDVTLVRQPTVLGKSDNATRPVPVKATAQDTNTAQTVPLSHRTKIVLTRKGSVPKTGTVYLPLKTKPTSAVAVKLPGTGKIVCKGSETITVSSKGNEKSVISQSVRKTGEALGKKERKEIQSQNNAYSALKITPFSGLKSLPNVPSRHRLELGTVAKNTAKIGLRSENITNISNTNAEITKNVAEIYQICENTANMAKNAHARQNFEKEKEVGAGPQRTILKFWEPVKQNAGPSEISRRINKKVPEPLWDVNSGSVSDETISAYEYESLPSVHSTISPFAQPTVFHVPALTQNHPLPKDMVEHIPKPSRPTAIPDHPESHLESNPASNTQSPVDFASNSKGNAAMVKHFEKLLMQKPDTATSKTPIWKSKQQREKDAAAEKELSGEPNDDSTTLPSDMLVPLPTIIPPPKSNRIRSSYSAPKIARRISFAQTVDKQQCDQSDAETANESSAAKQQKRKELDKLQKSTPSIKTGRVSKNVRQRSKSPEASQKSQQKDTFQKKVSKKTRKSSYDDFQMFSSDGVDKFSNRSNIENSSEDSDCDLPDLHCDVERSSSSNIRNRDDALLETSNRRKDKHPRTQLTFHQKGRFDPDELQAAVCLSRSDQASVSQETSNLRKYNNCRRQATFNRTTLEKDLRNSVHEEIEPAILNDSKKNVGRDFITVSSDSDSDDETLGYGKAELLEMWRQHEKSAEDDMDEKCDSNAKELDTGTSPSNDGRNRSDRLLNRSSSVDMRVSQPDSCHSNESTASPQSTYRSKDTTIESYLDITGSSESSGEEIVSKSKKHKKTKYQASRKRKAMAISSDEEDSTFIPDDVNTNERSYKTRRRCASKTSVKSGQKPCVVSSSDASSEDNMSSSFASEKEYYHEIQEKGAKNPDCQGYEPVSQQQNRDAAVLSRRDLKQFGDGAVSFSSPAERVKVCRRNTSKSGELKGNNSNKNKWKMKDVVVSISGSDNLRTITPQKRQPMSERPKPRSEWDKLMWNSTWDGANESDSGDESSDKSSSSSPLSQEEDCDVTKSTSTCGKSLSNSDVIHEEGMNVVIVSKSSDVELESKCEDRNSDGAHRKKDLNVEASTWSRFNSPAEELSSFTASPDMIAAVESTTSSSRVIDAIPEISEEVLPKPVKQPRRRNTARKSIHKPSAPQSVTLLKCAHCLTLFDDVELRNKHIFNDCQVVKRLWLRKHPNN